MVKKEFTNENKYIHIPVHGGSPKGEGYYYVEIHADGEKKNEIYIGITPSGADFDFYVPFRLNRYSENGITLVCREEGAPENLFDGIKFGASIFEEKELYPDLYNEYERQQLHFSPARGWTNDANGLFFKDGKFNLYFQHAPFGNHHNGVNISWGHAQTADGVHYKEFDDAILVRNWDKHIASGSALVDEHNLSGLGSDTILAAYTDLDSITYHGREHKRVGVCQNLMYSTDGGMNFEYFDFNPILVAPDGENWRDPKLLQIDENTLAIAVFEKYEGENCISFYKSHNLKDWEFCSRIMNFYECPDLFKLKVEETGEEMWVVYGGSGRYSIGHFENFEFKTVESGGYLDYGLAVYAGQSYNNYPSDEKRYFTAWIGENNHRRYHIGEPLNKVGFAHCLSILSELSIHKTSLGYRLFRKPVDEFARLRKNPRPVKYWGGADIDPQTEIVLTLDKDHDAAFIASSQGFKYIASENKIITSSFKEYKFAEKKDINLRIIVDRRSIEMCLNDEIILTFSSVQPNFFMVDTDYYIKGTIYDLDSIWEK